MKGELIIEEKRIKEYLGLCEEDSVFKDEIKAKSIHKKKKKKIKKLNKALKNQEKVLKKLVKLHKSDMKKESDKYPKRNEVVDKTAQSNERAHKDLFLNKLGDAIIKAIPTIINTLITTFFSFVFKGKQGNKGMRLGVSRG